VGARPAQHFLAFTKGRFDRVEGHRTNYKERHFMILDFGFQILDFRIATLDLDL
jgi:hypothetical protein